MVFREIIEDARQDAIRLLVARATTANRLAKGTQSRVSRRRFYEQKVQAISRLIEMGAAGVDEYLLGPGLVTVSLSNGRRLHAPARWLSDGAKRIVRTTVLSQFMEVAQ